VAGRTGTGASRPYLQNEPDNSLLPQQIVDVARSTNRLVSCQESRERNPR